MHLLRALIPVSALMVALMGLSGVEQALAADVVFKNVKTVHVRGRAVKTVRRRGVRVAHVRGRVVKMRCSLSRARYIRCRTRPLRTVVDFGSISVDGSVSDRSVATDRRGRFSVSVHPGYYVFAPRPPSLGMPTEPVEITLPPGGTSITLRVDVGHQLY